MIIQPATASDLAAIEAQLGRMPRGVLGVAARCATGHPAVIATAPRLPGGEPFPTFYYLTCPNAVAAASHLEATGRMREAEALLSDPDTASAYLAAHQAYLHDRNVAAFALLAATSGESIESVSANHPDPVPEIEGISAGGMPTRVKCLHALVGHALAAGPGVNPIGDWALTQMRATPESPETPETPESPEKPWSPETCNWQPQPEGN